MTNQLNEENVAEFVGQIVDILEDYLTEKGVAPCMLPNEDRDRDYGSSDDNNGAIIYGSDYDFIDEAVREELDVLGLVGTGVVYKNLSAVYLSACHIFDNGYYPIIKKIDGLDWTKEDTENMHDMIVLTFKNWGLYSD